MHDTNSSHYNFVGAPLVAASSNPSAVHRANTSPNGLFGAPIVSTIFFFAFPAVPHAKSSLFDVAGAPLPAAILHYRAMCDTNSSPIHPFGASLVLAIQTPPRYTHLAHPSYLQVFFSVASLLPDVLPSDLSPSSLSLVAMIHRRRHDHRYSRHQRRPYFPAVADGAVPCPRARNRDR